MVQRTKLYIERNDGSLDEIACLKENTVIEDILSGLHGVKPNDKFNLHMGHLYVLRKRILNLKEIGKNTLNKYDISKYQLNDALSRINKPLEVIDDVMRVMPTLGDDERLICMSTHSDI